MEDKEISEEIVKDRLTFENAPDIMDKFEVAKLLHVSPQTIYNLSNKKNLQCIYILGARRFTKRSVYKFIYDQTKDEMFNPDKFISVSQTFINKLSEKDNTSEVEASL